MYTGLLLFGSDWALVTNREDSQVAVHVSNMYDPLPLLFSVVR